VLCKRAGRVLRVVVNFIFLNDSNLRLNRKSFMIIREVKNFRSGETWRFPVSLTRRLDIDGILRRTTMYICDIRFFLLSCYLIVR